MFRQKHLQIYLVTFVPGEVKLRKNLISGAEKSEKCSVICIHNQIFNEYSVKNCFWKFLVFFSKPSLTWTLTKFQLVCQNCILRVWRNIFCKPLYSFKNISVDAVRIGKSPKKKVYILREWFYFRRIHYDGNQDRATDSPFVLYVHHDGNQYWENDFPFVIYITTENNNFHQVLWIIQ